MCFGPVIGVVLFEMGGYTAPFITFAVIFLAYCFMVKPLVPEEVDDVEDISTVLDTSEYSYSKLLKNKRILFANFALIVNIFQYTFIDPFLADRMWQDFGYDQKITGLMFFFLGLGYALACQFAYRTLQFMSYRR